MDLNVLRHYQTGVDKLDTEHLALFIKINEIIKTLGDKDKTLELLIEFTQASELHYAQEEVYMMTIDFPFIYAHRQDHAKLTLKNKSLFYDIKLTARPDSERYLVQELSRQLLFHIDYYDLQITEYLKKKTVQ